MSIELTILIVVIVALIFDFTNGFHDAANAMATSVATGAFKPKVAVLLAAIMNLIGACLATEVAKTISGGLVADSLITAKTVFAALVGAILWNLLTWLFGMPSSSSHAVFGALIGAVLVEAGMAGVNFSVVISKILLPALIAPLVAGVASYLATKISYRGAHSATKAVKKRYRTAQRVSSLMVALAHGTADGQKTMGIIMLVLIVGTTQLQEISPGVTMWWHAEPGAAPHLWVILLAGIAIALGTYSGGWRIMRTMGKGMADIEPPQGFAVETSAMAAILASSHFGFGLSTTHVVSGAVMGTGLARTPDEVRWGTAGRMLSAWLLTLPAAGIIAAAAAWLVHLGDGGFITAIVFLVVSAVVIKIVSSHNHVSSENVNDSHEVKVLAKAAVSSQTARLPNPLLPPLTDKLTAHPMESNVLRLTRLKAPKQRSVPKVKVKTNPGGETDGN
ncbi:MAG: inorganic phosphate transporter [Propionibacteriaceae bacterium]|jgi:PiT family inorganic phosphate transporter|nr:inorganic phosphate transporter [Propionibacteriaceae bacterium]